MWCGGMGVGGGFVIWDGVICCKCCGDRWLWILMDGVWCGLGNGKKDCFLMGVRVGCRSNLLGN